VLTRHGQALPLLLCGPVARMPECRCLDNSHRQETRRGLPMRGRVLPEQVRRSDEVDIAETIQANAKYDMSWAEDRHRDGV
jgi:hypothetical protein